MRPPCTHWGGHALSRLTGVQLEGTVAKATECTVQQVFGLYRDRRAQRWDDSRQCQAALAFAVDIHEAEAALKCGWSFKGIALQQFATRPVAIAPVADVGCEAVAAAGQDTLQPQDALRHLGPELNCLCLHHVNAAVSQQYFIPLERSLWLELLSAVNHMGISNIDLPAHHVIRIARLWRMRRWPQPVNETNIPVRVLGPPGLSAQPLPWDVF